MSLAAYLVGGLVVVWLLVTAVAHFDPFKFWINRIDVCHLVPRWNFFAPNPGNRDYYLVARIRHADGQLSAWENIPIYRTRPAFAWVWHPQKRAAKILFDAVQSIRFLQIHESVSPSGLPFTLPYLLLLRAVCEATPAPDTAAEIQFAVAESTGHGERELECSFLSSFHRY